MADAKVSAHHAELALDNDADIAKEGFITVEEFDGDVNLAPADGTTYLIPAPSADPRDPLNLPLYRKLILLAVVALFSSIGLSMVSGLGGLLGIFIPGYVAEGKGYADITNLMTYPTLFMGLGNLIGMPLALAVGRRPVYLGSCIVMVVASVLCATQKNYEWHLAARMVLGLAAGQSEALCPLMVQETFFLHERAKYQMIFSAIGNILTTVLVLMASYIAARIGADGWYGLGAGFAGLVLVLSILFVPETKYDRPLAAYQGQTMRVGAFAGQTGEANNNDYIVHRLTTTDERELDLVRFAPRTFASDLRLFVYKPDWSEATRTIYRMFTVMFFPDIMWGFLLNGLTLGVNVAIGTTYGAILEAAPYSWPSQNVSFATAGQIIVSFLSLPILGWGSDWIVKYFARRNGGVHQPQFRLVPLILPACVGVLSSILYGQAASHPGKLHWFAIAFAVNAYYFCFLGANQSAIVYALDAYPTRSGPVLVVICAYRGILSFGTSYAVQPFIDLRGYDGAFLVYGLLTGVLAAIGIPIYFFSARIRAYCSKYTTPSSTTKPTYS
ncbi:hypothetical protein SBRCBS47491_003958 [Sporothrix bragantina]|uniref:Major facilitator superfamily (MFS) profile domain-containing protein n=1 Tax=Sporothrix bragantina TaxID=671064 RepID=A0ABP0BJF7_9PEZI